MRWFRSRSEEERDELLRNDNIRNSIERERRIGVFRTTIEPYHREEDEITFPPPPQYDDTFPLFPTSPKPKKEKQISILKKIAIFKEAQNSGWGSPKLDTLLDDIQKEHTKLFNSELKKALSNTTKLKLSDIIEVFQKTYNKIYGKPYEKAQ